MKRRVFIALPIPEVAREKIAHAVAEWRWLPIRWLPPENWHVTVIPPVYLEDGELRSLVTLLETRELGAPFEIAFTSVLLAPPDSPARMVWLEGSTPPGLTKLQRRILQAWSSALTLSLPEIERRSPRLHVTLARFGPGDLRELETKTRTLAGVKIRFTAGELTVMESRLKATGAEYGALAMITLVPH